jgi:tRNA-2-methylthio-N6-dimethylallyladenosine synthase
MADSLPEEEKSRRLGVLQEHQKEIQKRLSARHVGQTLEVMVEGKNEARGQVIGRTSQNRPLNFTVTDGNTVPEPGSYVRVHVRASFPNSLLGEMVG